MCVFHVAGLSICSYTPELSRTRSTVVTDHPVKSMILVTINPFFYLRNGEWPACQRFVTDPKSLCFSRNDLPAPIKIVCQETKRRWFNSANPIQESATSSYRPLYTSSPAKEKNHNRDYSRDQAMLPIKFLVLTKRTAINGDDPDGSIM